jgi:hypothetical protein
MIHAPVSGTHGFSSKAGAYDQPNNETMKNNPILILIGVAILSGGCSTVGNSRGSQSRRDPETVLVRYNVKPGKEAELQAVLEHAWQLYVQKHLVVQTSHVLVKETTKEGIRTSFVEILTWVSRSVPDNAPDEVMSLWKQEHSLCEKREGSPAIDISEVGLVD